MVGPGQAGALYARLMAEEEGFEGGYAPCTLRGKRLRLGFTDQPFVIFDLY